MHFVYGSLLWPSWPRLSLWRHADSSRRLGTRIPSQSGTRTEVRDIRGVGQNRSQAMLYLICRTTSFSYDPRPPAQPGPQRERGPDQRRRHQVAQLTVNPVAASAVAMRFRQPDGSIADNGVGIRPPHSRTRHSACRCRMVRKSTVRCQSPHTRSCGASDGVGALGRGRFGCWVTHHGHLQQHMLSLIPLGLHRDLTT
jgi:hypothetical protein